MLTVRVGRATMSRRQKLYGRALLCLFIVVPAVLLLLIALQSIRVEDTSAKAVTTTTKRPAKHLAGTCPSMKECPLDQFSFYVQSGAADAVAPKICIQNRMVLGTQLKNAGPGINIVIMDGKTGAVTKTDHFNMYSGNVEPLIELLKDIQTGSTVLFASFDDPATKLNEEARTLIAEMGSSSVKSLRFRDSWAFVGAKGSAVKDKFEEHIKNDRNSNKYTNWPELVYFEGCIPKFQE